MAAPVDIPALAEELLDIAVASEHGRAAELAVHDGPLRQTVIALTEGTRLAEHNAPPAASLQVLVGRVRVEQGDAPATDIVAGHLLELTHERHAVLALEDSAFLLTTVTSVDIPSHG